MLRSLPMSLRGAAFIAGAFEHPRRDIPDRTVAQVHAEVADGALRDAGLSLADVDAYYCAGDAPGFGGLSMGEYLGLRCRTYDSTETGGSSYLVHVGHAAAAIAAGHASVALITLAGTPRNGGSPPGGGAGFSAAPESEFENLWGSSVVANYALAARRHMHEFGTTSEPARRDQGRRLAARPAQPARLPARRRDRRRGRSPRRSSPTHCTDSTAVSSPTAAGPSSSSARTSRRRSTGRASRCSATARRPRTVPAGAST